MRSSIRSCFYTDLAGSGNLESGTDFIFTFGIPWIFRFAQSGHFTGVMHGIRIELEKRRQAVTGGKPA